MLEKVKLRQRSTTARQKHPKYCPQINRFQTFVLNIYKETRHMPRDRKMSFKF